LLRARLRLAMFARDYGDSSPIDSENEPEVTLRADRQYKDALKDVPKFLLHRDEALELAHPYLKAQRLMFTIGISSTTINLHRKFFQTHFHDHAYAEGALSTISAAEKIMHSLLEFEAASLPAPRWWGVLSHAYRAAVILLLEHQLKQEITPTRHLSPCRVHALTLTIKLLSGVQNVVSTAGKASLILQHLLEEAQHKFSLSDVGHGHKRSRIEVDFEVGSELSPPSPGFTPPPAKKQKHRRLSSTSIAGWQANAPTDSKNVKEVWDRILDLEVELEMSDEKGEYD